MALILLFLPAWAQAQSPATQAERWDYEQYYVAYLNGERVGYMVARERQPDERTIESFSGLKLRLAAGPAVVDVAVVKTRREGLDGRPLGFSDFIQMAANPIRRQGVIRDGRLELTSTQFGRSTTRAGPWDEAVRFDAAVRRLLLAKLRADGDSLVVMTYDSDLPGDGTAPTTIKRLGVEEIEVNRRKLKAIHTVATNPRLPAPADDWVDEDFRTLAAEMSLGPAMRIRLEACSRAFARKEFDAPELFLSGLIQLEKPLGPPEKIRSLTLTLAFRKPLADPLTPPQTDRQATVESTRQKLVVRLTRPAYPTSQQDEAPLPEAIRPYLQAGEMLDADDPAIQRAAGKAVGQAAVGPGSAGKPLVQAKALRDFVARHVVRKTLGVGAGSASEVLRTGAGDCTEHAVLLAALARATGLPARTVCGLVYVNAVGDRKGVLGFHEWTQLYLGGRWVDFDAAIPGDPAIAPRLALLFGTAEGKLDTAAVGQVYGLFGNVRSAAAADIEAD